MIDPCATRIYRMGIVQAIPSGFAPTVTWERSGLNA
jgi:hypothetical protein